jgi:predicted Rossmann-fold nucleotide-binding protein
MKVLICGGRDFTDYKYMKRVMDDLIKKRNPSMIIHGGARGADTLAGDYATKKQIITLIMPAEWNKYGKPAGMKRNRDMLNENPDLVVAFPGGVGTKGMIKIAKDKGTEVISLENHYRNWLNR